MTIDIKIGDRIRSYDFRPRPDVGDCYVEGVVIETGPELVCFVVDNIVWRDAPRSHGFRFGKDMYTAAPGTFEHEYPGRITIIEAKAPNEEPAGA